MPLPVILIFDVGKTNKKLFLFDEDYKIVYEDSIRLDETKDEDGFPCEDINALTRWVKDSFHQLINNKQFEIKAINFSAYGASFVLIDSNGKVCAPLYNYLKPYNDDLRRLFYKKYGDEKIIAQQTASPNLGSLNSGMQLYRLKYEKPELYKCVKYALHLPQYLSYIFTGKVCSDITSIGCHTQLWDFEKNTYHNWVFEENIDEKFPPIYSYNTITQYEKNIAVGIGLHDSSAALIPYLKGFKNPFVLLSTGTWCISLNPFNQMSLTNEQLKKDCLCYLSYKGKPVKASRLFAGYLHDQQAKNLAKQFNKNENEFTLIKYNKDFLNDKHAVISFEQAYHQLISNIIKKQVESLQLILENDRIENIYIDGGFTQNDIYMNLLAGEFKSAGIYKTSVAQASALGAAIVLHKFWNSKALPAELIACSKQY